MDIINNLPVYIIHASHNKWLGVTLTSLIS